MANNAYDTHRVDMNYPSQGFSIRKIPRKTPTLISHQLVTVTFISVSYKSNITELGDP